MAKEITYLYYEWGYQAMAIPDDIFILDRRRTGAIALHFQRYGIMWRCLVRADLIVRYGPEFVKMLADTGCHEVGMGIESASDKILKLANKGETSSQMRKAVEMLKGGGIRVKGYFILGLPGETPETIADTEKFLEEMQLDDMDIKIFQPYPGSPIWFNKDILDIDWKNIELEKQFYKGRMGEYHGNVRTAALTNKQIVAAMNRLEGRFKRAS